MTVDRGLLERIRSRGEEVLTQVSAELMSNPRLAKAMGAAMRGKEKVEEAFAKNWNVIVWNDPVNLMDYVTHVFQQVFGWQRQKAEFHMLQVHEQGKSLLTRESMEKAEHYVHQLQKYTLHATMERDE